MGAAVGQRGDATGVIAEHDERDASDLDGKRAGCYAVAASHGNGDGVGFATGRIGHRHPGRVSARRPAGYGRPMPVENATNPTRQLAKLIEPVTGQVYFSPECHTGYQALGFAGSPGKLGATELPDGPAYFTSRGSVMGQVPGEVVAAAFGVFSPAAVVSSVAHGWTLTDAATICAARETGAIAQLKRVLGDSPEGLARVTELFERMTDTLRPEGRPLYAGLRSQAVPDDPIGRMWRHGDMLRECRGDCHTAAWTSAGVDATEIGLLTELYWGLPLRSYSRTRAWTEAEFDAADERLRSRGLLDGDGFTPAGRALRESIEIATDAPMASALRALGDDADELFALLEPWGAALRASGAYLSSGADDLAERGASL